MPLSARFWAALLLAAPAAAQPSLDFEGYVGRLDAVQLGEDWYTLTPATMPSLPLEGVTVTVLDCGENCPDPVRTDAAGWFSIPGLGQDLARLHFEPPACDENDLECEPLEPRQEVLENGGRTVLGAKWPADVEDTMLRYMPSVAGTLYVKREGEIPGIPAAAGGASTWVVWTNGVNGWQQFLETRTFLHELMHVYERRLRLTCWHRHQDIDGFVLEESWLQAYDADRALLDQLGMPLEEPDAYELSEYSRARETLARFAEDYFTPEALMLEWRQRPTSARTLTYGELEQYAPHRYAFFERLVFGRYLDRKSWERANPDAESWPGMCSPPPETAWALDRLPPLPGLSKSSALEYPLKSSSNSKWSPEHPPVKCSLPGSN